MQKAKRFNRQRYPKAPDGDWFNLEDKFLLG